MEENNDSGLGLSFTFVMENIYQACDKDENDAVPASTLIDYIKPFILNHQTGITVLQLTLDPNNEDTKVSKATFCEAMKKWREQIDQNNKLSNFFNSSIREAGTFDENHFWVHQSTPRKTLAFMDRSSLNISNFAATDFNKSIHEKNHLEENYNELQHKYKNLLNEVSLVKSQLITNEEQFIELQMELEQTNIKLKIEQQLVTELQKNREFDENLKEEELKDAEDIAQLKEMLSLLKNDNTNLLKRIKNNDFEREQTENELMQKNERLEEESRNLKNVLIAMQSENENLEKMMKINEKCHDDEQSQVRMSEDVRDITNDLERVESNRNILEDNITLKETPKQIEDTLVYTTPFKNMYHPSNFNREIYNSPRFIQQLFSPISPGGMDTPNSKKSLGLNKRLDKSVQTETSSTDDCVQEDSTQDCKEPNDEIEQYKEREKLYIDSIKAFKKISGKYIFTFNNKIIAQVDKIKKLSDSEVKIVRFVNELKTDLYSTKMEFDLLNSSIGKTTEELVQVYKGIFDLKNELFDEKQRSIDLNFQMTIANLEKLRIKLQAIKRDDIMRRLSVNELTEKNEFHLKNVELVKQQKELVECELFTTKKDAKENECLLTSIINKLEEELMKHKQEEEELSAKILKQDKIIPVLKKDLTCCRKHLQEYQCQEIALKSVLAKKNEIISILKTKLVTCEHQKKHLIENQEKQLAQIEQKILDTQEYEKSLRRCINEQKCQIETLKNHLEKSAHRENAFEKSLLEQKSSLENLKNILTKYEEELILKGDMLKQQEKKIDTLKEGLSKVTSLSQEVGCYKSEIRETECLLSSTRNMLTKSNNNLKEAENRILTLELLLEKCKLVIFDSAGNLVRGTKFFFNVWKKTLKHRKVEELFDQLERLGRENIDREFNEEEIWKVNEELILFHELILELSHEDEYEIRRVDKQEIRTSEENVQDLPEQSESPNSYIRYVQSFNMVVVIVMVIVFLLFICIYLECALHFISL